jgi:hypothetical protein
MVLETSFLPDALRGILGWFFIMPIIYLSGSFFKKWVNEADEFMEGHIFFALGLGLLGTLINLLSISHAYRPLGVIVMGLLIIILRINYIGRFFSWCFRFICFPFDFIKTSPLFGLMFLFAIVFSFLFALLPEIANDALTYHFNIPKELVWQHSTMPLIFDFNSYTPMLMNLLYGVGLMFNSMAMAKLFHWFAGYVLVLAIFSISLKTSTNRLIAFWMSLLCLLTPTLLNEITSTYVDGAVCLFVVLCFYLFHRSLHEFENKTSFFIAGLLLGFAVSTKIIMLLAIPTLFLAALLLCLYRRSFKLLLRICIYLGCGFAVATAFWFIRNAILMQNPFFPYLGSILGHQDFGFVEQFQNMGEPKSVMHYLRLPFDMTFKPQYFDLGYPLGLYFIVAIPFAVYASVKKKEYSYQIFFVWLFTSLWYLFFHNIRFLLPVLLLLAPMAAVGLKEFLLKEKFKRGWRITAVTLLFSAMLFLQFAYFIYHYRLQFKVLSGGYSRQSYIRDIERSFDLSKWIETHLPKKAKILNAEENRGFYLNRPSVRETWFRYATNYHHLSAGAVYELLIEKGFTHIIRVRPLEAAATSDPNLDTLDKLLTNKHYARLLVQIDSQNKRESRSHYNVFELLEPQKA